MATNRDVVPAASKTRPVFADKVPPSIAPALSGQHNFATDPSMRHGREMEPHHANPHSHSVMEHNPANPHLHGAMEHSPANPHSHSVPAMAPGRLGAPHMTRSDRDRHFFSTDDNALVKQIVGTHAPDHEELDVKPILAIVEDIMRLAKPTNFETPTVHGAQVHAHQDSSLDHDKALVHSTYHDTDIVRFLAYPINKISCEIICKCAAGGEAHSVTMSLLSSLSSYTWDAKVVITFAAFAINYGEFWLVEQLYTKNPLAKDIAVLKDLPETMEQGGDLRKKFDAVLNLLTQVQNLTHIIIKFNELPSEYISKDSPEMASATAHIPTTVYWLIRSILACASILLNLVGSGHEYIASNAESWEILSLAHKLSHMYEHLQKQLEICNDLIVSRQRDREYDHMTDQFNRTHIDNMKILKLLIPSREDQRPLWDGSRKTNERLEALRGKYVLLLISDLDPPQEELHILHMIYNQQTMRHEYEVLWLPIVDRTWLNQTHEPQFHALRNSMPWFSVDHPNLVNPVAIRYIRQVWKFIHMPVLVVLDPQGRVSNLNALPMMWIWAGSAFPFTKQREEALWAGSSWNMELLAEPIDPRITDWIKENKVICLYGGDDIEWIRKFTMAARAAATALHIPLEMLYVGKSNPKEQKVRRCHEIIDREKLSHIFSATDYYDYVWFFWARLSSMWNSKLQHGMTVENDKIMQQIVTMLTFDSSEQGWAVFSHGHYDMAKGKGDVVLPVLENFNKWGYRVDHPEKFVPVLDEEISGLHLEHHCNRLILPGHTGYIPERVVCSECGRTMDKYVMYRCCTD